MVEISRIKYIYSLVILQYSNSYKHISTDKHLKSKRQLWSRARDVPKLNGEEESMVDTFDINLFSKKTSSKDQFFYF